jgi:GT2 family glycosyltransferase
MSSNREARSGPGSDTPAGYRYRRGAVSAVDEQPEDAEPVPPVVAVVVTHDPGDWFEDVLAGLAAQDYPMLSVLVIDAGSAEDPTDRVAAVLPDAHVHRLGANPGFGAAANEVIPIVHGAAFHLLCHDDVALQPGAVRELVLEAFRSNAGIVGPKLVMWDEPGRLLQVGMSIDKTGHEIPLAERGELDQEQHDAIADVFCIPGGATLVRADLFEALGGFDPAITYLGEDLDLCWRAHLAGARVLVVPSAVARHREALGERGPAPAERRRLAFRHRYRLILTNYSRGHRWRVVPQVAVLSVLEVIYATIAGRRRLASDIVAAWRWARSPDAGVAAARARVEAMRSVPDAELRRLQTRGFARLALFVRGQLGRSSDDRVNVFTRSAGEVAGSMRRGPLRATVIAWVAIVVVVLFGSRHHLSAPVPLLIDLPQLPGRPGPLLAEWLSGWRGAGLGSRAPQPTSYGLLGLGSTLLLGSTVLLGRLLSVAPLLIGPVGAARLVAPAGSARAPWIAAVTYAVIPLPYGAMANGHWGGLVVWAATPWIVRALARATGSPPFGGEWSRQPLWRAGLSLGIGTAVVAAVEPLAALLPLGLALLLATGGVLAGSARGTGRVGRFGHGPVSVALVALGVTLVLHLPWLLELVGPDSTWAAIGGVIEGAPALSMAEIARFNTGPIGSGVLGFAFLVSGLLPLLIGQGWRLGWAVRAWVLVAGGWLLAVVAGMESFPLALGPVELLLAPAACGLALATALGMVAFEQDLRGYRFGWRQVASLASVVAVALGAVPVVVASAAGDWDSPRRNVGSVLGFLDSEQQEAGPFRTLWIGDPEVLPLSGWELSDGVSWGLTDRGYPNATDRWSGSPRGGTGVVQEAVETARQRETARLGALLAPAGVRYIVFVEADRPLVSPTRPMPTDLVGAMEEQLDLAELEVDASVRVFRNTAWVPSRAVLDVDDLPASAAALEDVAAVAAYEGPVEDGDLVWQSASSSEGWSLSVDGGGATQVEPSSVEDLAPGFDGGNVFEVDGGGDAELRYGTPVGRLALSGAQAALWVLAVVLVWRTRPRRNGNGTAA